MNAIHKIVIQSVGMQIYCGRSYQNKQNCGKLSYLNSDNVGKAELNF